MARPIYFNDKSLPQKYRYGNLEFAKVQEQPIEKENILFNNMPVDEQKHMIYNLTFVSLNSSTDYNEFKDKLQSAGVSIAEHRNTRGIYGISFRLGKFENAETFKASDVSRKLSYNSINNYFDTKNTVVAAPSVLSNTTVSTLAVADNRTVIHEMQNSIEDISPRYTSIGNYMDEDMTLLSGKRRRKNRKDNNRYK